MAGSGAVTVDSGRPMKHIASPNPTAARNPRSRDRKRSPSRSGARITMYNGAVDCRKIAFADVVSLVDVTNSVSVAA